MKHFINLSDFNKAELNLIIDNAIILKNKHKNGDLNSQLQNKSLAMIFDKPSTRTRVSFEAGMTQLGGSSLFLSNIDTQIGRGESIKDSSKVISSMVDCVMLRLSSHADIEEFAKNSSVPIINALSDESHPCQLLADLMTFKELNGDITGKTITWIGDGNNMANTWSQASQIFDFTLNMLNPKGYKIAKKFISNNLVFFDKALDACKETDAINTDVWASMGQETEQKLREKCFNDYQVNQAMMDNAKQNVIFMHCLPAYRGKEVSNEVIDGAKSVIYQQAENRLHVQKSLLLYLMI